MAKKSITRPTHVGINGIDWELRWLDGMEWRKEGLEDGARGLTRFNEREICVLVEPYMSEAVVRDTLMHEVQHAIWDAAAIRQSLDVHDVPNDVEDREEYLILRITGPMLYFIQYNPDVVTYLQDVQ